MNTNNNTEQIHGCDDFQSLIPAYLDGKLSTARTLLLEDHSNECIPCRQELKAQRAFAAAKSAMFVPRQPARRSNAGTATHDAKRMEHALKSHAGASRPRWSSVSGSPECSCTSVSTCPAARLRRRSKMLTARFMWFPTPETRQLAAGEQLQKGERVRTAKDSNAVLRLADGSTVEMRERSEFSVSENMRGVTIKLDRGDVIVEAAKQHNGRLYVQTPDSLVSVKGTIFAVESGTKGSRVSVVEGEVKVNHAGKDETLASRRPDDDKPQFGQNSGRSRTSPGAATRHVMRISFRSWRNCGTTLISRSHVPAFVTLPSSSISCRRTRCSMRRCRI